MSTPFNASKFRSKLSSVGGPATNNYYEVEIILRGEKPYNNVLNNILNGNTKNNNETTVNKLTYRAHAVDLPGRQLETLERRYSGPMKNIPVGHVYTTLQVQFLEWADRETRNTFDKWQEVIADARKATGFSALYYDQIVADIEIRVYNRHAHQGRGSDKLDKLIDGIMLRQEGADAPEYVMSHKFYEVYPISIGASQLSWDMQNQLITIPIEFAYHRWESAINPKYMPYVGIETRTFGKDKSPFGVIDNLKEINRNFQNFVKNVNNIKTQINSIKRTYNEVKSLYNTIKNYKPKFGTIDQAIESVDQLGRISQRTVNTAESVANTKPPTFFDSKVKNTNTQLAPVFTGAVKVVKV